MLFEHGGDDDKKQFSNWTFSKKNAEVHRLLVISLQWLAGLVYTSGQI